LEALHSAALGSGLLEPLGMRDPSTGDHPIHLAGTNGLLRTDTVAVHDLSGEEIRHGGESNMRVRTDIEALGNARREIHRTKAIEENKGADHAVWSEWQQALNLESTAEVPSPRLDDKIYHLKPAFGFAKMRP